jgi:hypothetical protein
MPRPDFERLTDATPHARFLSNGRFTTLVTSAGTGGSWPGFRVALRLADGLTQVELAVKNANGRAAGVVSCRLDGAAAPVEGDAAHVRVPRDGARHELEIELG